MSQEEGFDPVLLNTFVISDQRCRVYFHRDVLIWERENFPFERNVVPASDILAVNQGTSSSSRSRTVDNDTRDSSRNSMVVHYAQKKDKNRWRTCDVVMRHGDERQISSWLKTLNNSLTKQNRPKNFLVFVNPFCGKRKGVEIYEKTVRPILDLAGVNANPVVTRHGSHVREVLFDCDSQKYDGIMAVGGDGTVSEIVNSLIVKSMRDENKDENDREAEVPRIKIPLAIVPGGSTDCIAYCLNGTRDRETAAVYAVLGERSGLDACSVHTSKGLCRYFLSSFGYGFLGDVLKESEKHRWMGPKRYDYAGFLKVLRNRRYFCEISMTLSPGEPGTGPKCARNCEACKEFPVRKNGKIRYRDDDLAAVRDELKLNSEEKKDPEKKSVTVQGKYFLVSCANISCACERSPNGIAPRCHLGDGSVDVLLCKPRTIFDVLRLLIRGSSKNEDEALSDLPFVDIYKASEVRVKALNENMETEDVAADGGRRPGASVWNCDGEIVFDSDVVVKNYRQTIQVFTRRWVPPKKTESFSCFGCYVCTRKNSNELV